MLKANQYAKDHGKLPFVIYQGAWNVLNCSFERDIIPMTRHQGMALCPYGVLGQGRFQTEEGYKRREKSKEGRNLLPLTDHDKKVSKALEEIAKAKKVERWAVEQQIIQSGGPQISGTTPTCHVRLHDDKSSYTGTSESQLFTAELSLDAFTCLKRIKVWDALQPHH